MGTGDMAGVAVEVSVAVLELLGVPVVEVDAVCDEEPEPVIVALVEGVPVEDEDAVVVTDADGDEVNDEELDDEAVSLEVGEYEAEGVMLNEDDAEWIQTFLQGSSTAAVMARWPLLRAPQHETTPRVLTEHVWSPPAVTATCSSSQAGTLL